jgi:hypothetical protein
VSLADRKVLVQEPAVLSSFELFPAPTEAFQKAHDDTFTSLVNITKTERDIPDIPAVTVAQHPGRWFSQDLFVVYDLEMQRFPSRNL